MVNRARDGFAAPLFVRSPLCHKLVSWSRKTNQMNMSVRGSALASASACAAYAACCARDTPFGSPSDFTSCPYSVIQMRTFFRLNHVSSDFSKRPNDASVTFGQRTF